MVLMSLRRSNSVKCPRAWVNTVIQLLMDAKHLKLHTVLKLLVNYYYSCAWLGKGMMEPLAQRIWQEVAGAGYCATLSSCRALYICRVLPKSPWLTHTANNTSGKQWAGSSQQEPPFVFVTDTSKMELCST